VTRAVLVTVALAATAPGARAQGVAPPPADTAESDSTRQDSLPVTLALPPAPAPQGPLPRGTRYTFTTDSLIFSSTKTLADVLARVPGVYVARGGLYGQSEVVLYGGRGAAALEVYWDGVPYFPVGRDSVYLDPARIPLAPLERVDVIVLPATLRIYLVSWRQSSTAATSEIGISTGQRDLTEYRAAFLKRWRSGFGLSLVADWNDVTSLFNSVSTPFHSTDLWFQLDYIPKSSVGASFQIVSADWHLAPPDSEVPARVSKRVDEILRVFVGGRPDGRGTRLDLTLANASVTNDPLVGDHSLPQANLTLSSTGSHTSASLTARYGPDQSPWQFEAQAAWNFLPPFTLAGDARHTLYSNDRKGDRAHATLGIALPLGFYAHGDVVWTREVGAPIFPTDTVQETTDLLGGIRLDQRWVTIDVGGARRDAYSPADAAFPGIDISGLGPTPPTNYLTIYGGLKLAPGLTLAGWYFDPVRNGGDFEPPRHGRYSLTFYSKFWRVYKSGIFALRAEAAVESWSSGGLAGFVRDSLTGEVRTFDLAPATFVDINAQIRIAGVTIFWETRNARAFKGGYVPGTSYPLNYQYYGVRWRFTN
jgi:hypothetical protein